MTLSATSSSESTCIAPVLRVSTSPIMRWMYIAFAVLCMALGFIGIFVPGLPTTVFILLAAWAAARSSPRLHAWLWEHRWFGPLLQNWADGRRVSRQSKWTATVTMTFCALLLFYLTVPLWARNVAMVNMVCVLTWLWLRPEPIKIPIEA